MTACKRCCKSIASCYTCINHDFRDRGWWYDSKGRATHPIHYYNVLPCDRWQQRGSLTKWHLKQRCGIELLHTGKKIIHWYWLSVYRARPVDVSTVRQWVHFSMAVVWKTTEYSRSCIQKQWVTFAATNFFYKHVAQAFVHQLQKCTASGGNYVEKVFCIWGTALSKWYCILYTWCNFRENK